MAATPWEGEEQRNYICLVTIIQDVVAEGLRSIFKQEWNSRYQASFGAWDDTKSSGQQLFNLEKTRSRPSKNVYQSKFQNGDTSQWDCSVLFDAILYSNSIGRQALNPTIQSEVDNLRKIRNELKHATFGKLTDAEFQRMIQSIENTFKALGLPINKVQQVVEIRKSRYKSFQILPPKPAHDVVYREEQISEIVNDLDLLYSKNDGKLTYFYISGNPGSGKSQLASQIWQRVYSENKSWSTETTFIMTLNAADLHSLLFSYEDFCRRLNCDEYALVNILNSKKSMEEKIKAMRSLTTSRIKNWKRWFIIADNVENLAEISPLLPQIGKDVWNNGQVLLTTQNTTSIPPDSLFCKHVSISTGMNSEECRKLLATLSKTDPNDPLLDEVSEQLDYQPLALASAGFYMKRVLESNSSTQFSWKDYLETLERGKREITEMHLMEYNKSAYSSTMSAGVLLAVAKCAENDPILKHAFQFLSFVSAEPLPRDLIVKYIQLHDEDIDREEIYLAVHECSLFLPAGNGDSDIRLHRVVHEAIKAFTQGADPETEKKPKIQSGNEWKQDRMETNVRNVIRALCCFEERDDKIKLVAHLKSFHQSAKKFGFHTCQLIYSVFEKMDIGKIYTFFLRILYDNGEHDLSMDFKNTIIEIFEGSEESFPVPMVYDLYNLFGLLHQARGELEQAKQYFERYLEVGKKLNPKHVDVATSYRNLGTVYRELGDLESAKSVYLLALDIHKEQLGPKHVDLATVYNNLGTVYRDLGGLERAKEYHLLALNIEKEQLGSQHLHVAASYNNLGEVYQKLGELERAKEYHLLALEIYKEHFGPEHVDVATFYNNLGTVYYDLGELERAKEYHLLTLEIRKEQLGPKHINVAYSYNNLGAVYHKLGELERAKECYLVALEIHKEQLGPKHIHVAHSYNNLGTVYHDLGELERAKEYLLLALEIRKEQLGPEHINVAHFYNNLGTVCYDLGELKRAKEYHILALEIRKEQLGPKHVDVAYSYNNLGAVYQKLGELERAKEYHLLALEIRKEQLGPKRVDVAASYYNLGVVCQTLEELERAKEYHLLGLEIHKEQLGPKHINVAHSYDNLGAVYYELGELGRAKEYHQLALEIRKEQLGQRKC